ncbi:MAG: sigma-70 family RNA polymerase sigma factor [Nitriliruptoraceae bacterium]
MIGPGFDSVLTAAQVDAPWAFQRLFEDLSPVVNGYLSARGADEPDDVASEAFLSVFRAIKEFEGDESDFRSWVFTIVHRRLIDERRKRGRTVKSTPLDEITNGLTGGNSEHEAVEAMSSQWVRDVLAMLSDDQRDVILLRVIADLSVNEVATIMDRRPGAIRALQHRAIIQLRERLDVGDLAVETLAQQSNPVEQSSPSDGVGTAQRTASSKPAADTRRQREAGVRSLPSDGHEPEAVTARRAVITTSTGTSDGRAR